MIITHQKVPPTALSFGKEDKTQKSHYEITKGTIDPSLSDIRAYELFNAPQYPVLKLEIMIGS